MKRKIFISLFFYFTFFNLHASEIKFEKVIHGLNNPWSLSFIDKEKIIFTEKSGKLYTLNLQNKKISKINHNLNVKDYGQGGLLDVLYNDRNVYISYSENRGDRTTSTSVAKGIFNQNSIKFNNIFRADPPIDSMYHFGSRLVIKSKHLYITAGERGKGMIAQDPTNHIGTIIRIHLDGSIPKGNPKFEGNSNWLPEIYQIGVRNPQGMSIDPLTQQVYISNHGPKGGDFIGPVIKGTNYGWKQVAWGGTNYSGTKVGNGNAWEPGLLKPDHIWVPSIGVGGIKFYQGNIFPEWNNSLLVASLKLRYLSVLPRIDNGFGKEEIIFKDKIGRIRDIEINQKGEIFLIADEYETFLYKLLP
mgnify:CR=1 FL=1